MSDDKAIATLLRRYRRDAVLLHRPYPPQEAPQTNSKFGGLPKLPAHYEWPRLPSGIPFHFLAQIDCADIPFSSILPERGVLFFFGRDDEEQIWDADRQATESCRVIYALDAFAATPSRSPPDDLPPIGGSYPRPGIEAFLRQGEPGPKVHFEWPIQPFRFDTWPDASAFGPGEFATGPDWRRLSPARLFESDWEALLRRWTERDRIAAIYDEALQLQRTGAFHTATGFPPFEPGETRNSNQTALRLLGSGDEPGAYPRHWKSVEFFFRAVRAWLTRGYGVGLLDATVMLQDAESWISRADAAPTELLSANDRTAFRIWIDSTRPVDPRIPIDAFVSDFLVKSARATVQSFAGDPGLAGSIPPSVYELLAPWFQGGTVFGSQPSQMLGHAPSSQEARSPDDPTVCLLNLASDTALGWMFGDMGEATFWISPDALARHDFDKAWGTIEGH